MNLAKRIELWPIERLRLYARNARTHGEDQVAKIAASIAEFGFVNPVLVATDDGIIAGHGRLAAAKSLGLTEVPVIVLDHLSETQRRAYVLADNKLAEMAGWDVGLLREEILALDQYDPPILTAAGFTDEELTAFLGDDGVLPDGMTAAAPADGASAPAQRPAPTGPAESAYREQYGVIVICSGEAEQEAVYNRLSDEGLTCRVVVT